MTRWKRALAVALAAVGLAAGDGAAAGEDGEQHGWRGAEVPESEGEVRGRVQDGVGEPVAAARVALRKDRESGGDDPLARAVAGSDGRFRMDGLEPGRYRVEAQAVGFRTGKAEVEVEPGTAPDPITVELKPEPLAIEGVAVGGAGPVAKPITGMQARTTPLELNADAIRAIPAAGEPDPLRAVETLPGVLATSDLAGSFNVRGGSADQNRILLDGIPIYGPFHLGGLFSVFNADLVDRTVLHAGDVPPRYQGGIASVLQVESDAGPGELGVDGGVSLLSTRAAVSGGLPSDAGRRLGLRELNWRASVRRSYLDQVAAPVMEIPYRFHDVQAVMEARTDGDGTLTLVGYLGGDRLDMEGMDREDARLRTDWDWGNRLVGGTWRRPVGSGHLEVRSGYTRFATGMGFLDYEDTDFGSRIQHTLVRTDYQRGLGGGWSMEVGLAADGKASEAHAETGFHEFLARSGRGRLVGGHGTLRWTRPGAWAVEAGGRLDRWSPSPGPAHWEPAPRGAVKRFFASGRGAITLSAGRHGQFHHALRDEDLPLAMDFWMLAGESAPPQRALQAGLGIEGAPLSGWFASLEGYARPTEGVATFNPVADPGAPDDNLLAGRGTARGLDALVRRDIGRLQGTLAVSWLRADRTFTDPRIEGDHARHRSHPPPFDRRLDVDLNLRFPLMAGWTGSLRWHVGTGLPYTRPEGSHLYLTPRQSRAGRWVWPGDPEVEAGYGNRAVVMGDRNAARYPTYHRLDVGLRRTFQRSWGEVSASLEVLNLYDRRNVLFYFYDFGENPPVRSGFSMVPFLPAAGMEVRF